MLWHLGKTQRALNNLTASSHLHSAPADNAPSQTTLFITGNRHSSCLFLRSRLQFPASLQNYAKASHIFLWEPRITPHPWYDKTWLPRPQFVPLFPSATSKWPRIVCGVPFSWAVEYMWLISCCSSHLSSVRCYVFNHPHNPEEGTPPSPTKGREGE